MRVDGLCAGLALVCVLLACGNGAAPGRAIVLGLDGVDPQVVDLLLSEGRLPSFARLRQQGAYAPLESAKPLLSPVVWTTIATGKTPLEHGISHFVATNEKTGEELPVTSRMRRVKALWNVLSDAGRRVGVVGWWATWPAETVRGAIVSDHTCYHFLFDAGAEGSPDPAGVTHPPELLAELAPLVRRPGDLDAGELARFVDLPPDAAARPFDFRDDLSHFKWALATAETYRTIGLRLWKEQSPDVLLVYVEGVDSTSHLFGHLFRQRDLSGALATQQARYGRAAEEMYRYADEIVGAFMDVLDDDTTLVVLSDHGFELGALHDDPSRARDLRRVSERFHRSEGILYLYGSRVRAGRRIDRPTILDVTPTLLALAGVPPAVDMPGRVLAEALELPAELTSTPRRVASYESATAPAGDAAAAAAAGGDAAVDPEIVEHLRALGYLDATSPRGERNLAALHFEKGEYTEAARMYEELVREKPDDASLHASLAGALGALGRFDESLAALDRAIALDPANPEAYHNRGVIHEKRGDAAAAVRDYETALRFAPDYEPSRNALLRLRGSALAASEPATPNEKLAAALVERAREATLHGDYAGALAKLDEAERIAPRFARVAHYRSNVAYLMGDRAGAIAALRRAIELEPENPLYPTNLERLEKQDESAEAPARPAPEAP
jgi:predicted AlkP superfamily phosphohydrolase/phosphomutase/Flp pilus assembly protein TadD